MDRTLFDFAPPAWFPVQDKAVLERCRTIPRSEMEYTNEHGYRVRVVPHPTSAITIELFEWIRRSDREDKKTVIIFPNSWRTVYTCVAQLCNRYDISARNLHCFCMDEFADENGRVAPVSYANSLGGHFLRDFYLPFREDLRPPFSQIHYITDENLPHYSDLIDETGDGGADLILSATGWVGHTAFIDPCTKKFGAETLEEFMQIPAGWVDNHRLTIIQNSNSKGSGDFYHTPRYSASIGPRDVVHARAHLERHDLGFLGGYSSWERMISRLQLYGPVCKEVPASLYQLSPGTVYVSETIAAPIAPLDFVAF